jgi:3-oxoadipate enol-lactonase
MKKIKFNGLHINDYEGSGFPLILVHAFPLNSEMWQLQIEFFKNQFRVVTYDVRGLGQSKSQNNQFTMETYANDLLSVIGHLNLEKVFVCGVSMGGYIIMRSYVKNPGKFKGIVLADTRAERDDNTGLINRSNVIASIINGKRKEFILDFLPKLINKKSYSNDKLRIFLENIIKENSDEGITGAQLALATRVNSIDYLKSFNVPTLILVGEDDILTPPSCAENMNNLIPDSELKIIKDSGHLSNLENPELFNTYITEFLKTHI